MLDLDLFPGEYAICRLPAGSGVPQPLVDAAASGKPGQAVSVTWTPYETSVMCPAELAPAEATVEPGWRCFRVVGPVNLTLTGIVAAFSVPLAEARVNIFCFSTYDTDYLLVNSVRLGEAIAALSEAGHRLSGDLPSE
ncbi:ACT domain-containing protein [Longispora albida]|uniref:ACT domain-containing protein n=1 Tax=Longispora albida TaxID=203523 RepID=UPI000362E919|nr:ACT domain-containing protein [Longispora albida]